jgi:hypothetical protein
MATGTSKPVLDSINFSIVVAGEPFVVTVSFDGPAISFDATVNPFDCLTIEQMRHLIGRLTEIVDKVEKFSVEELTF